MRQLFHNRRTVSILLSVIFTSCSSPVKPSESGELMPLSIGSYWLYQDWSFMEPETLRGQITRKISVTIDGITYEGSAYLLPYPLGGPVPPFEWLYWNGPDGLYSLGGISKTDTLLYKTLMFKYPASVGDSWTVVRINYDGVYQKFFFFDTLTFTLVSKDEAIETPAGKFKCYVYKYRKRPAEDVAEEWDYYHYYYPGIGRLAYITKSVFDGRTIDRTYLITWGNK